MRFNLNAAVRLAIMLFATSAALSADGSEDGASGNAGLLPEGDGRDAVMQSCLGACHQPNILLQPYSAQEWAQCVDDMIALGAHISDDDYVPIILYLAKHYSPTAETP